MHPCCVIRPPLLCYSLQFESRQRHRKRKSGGGKVKDREWVLKKKEQMRRKGYDISQDSKYTARKRRKVI